MSIFKRAYIFVQDSLVGGPMTIQNSTFWHISNFCKRKGSQAIAAPINCVSILDSEHLVEVSLCSAITSLKVFDLQVIGGYICFVESDPSITRI